MIGPYFCLVTELPLKLIKKVISFETHLFDLKIPKIKSRTRDGKIEFYKRVLKIEENGEVFLFFEKRARKIGQVGFSESPPNFAQVLGSG